MIFFFFFFAELGWALLLFCLGRFSRVEGWANVYDIFFRSSDIVSSAIEMILGFYSAFCIYSYDGWFYKFTYVFVWILLKIIV